jgi:hypothetical protein
MMQRVGEPESFKQFFTASTAKEIYKLLMRLLERYQQEKYVEHTRKLATILIKAIIRDQQRDNFQRLIEEVQQEVLSLTPSSKMQRSCKRY